MNLFYTRDLERRSVSIKSSDIPFLLSSPPPSQFLAPPPADEAKQTGERERIHDEKSGVAWCNRFLSHEEKCATGHQHEVGHEHHPSLPHTGQTQP